MAAACLGLARIRRGRGGSGSGGWPRRASDRWQTPHPLVLQGLPVTRGGREHLGGCEEVSMKVDSSAWEVGSVQRA